MNKDFPCFGQMCDFLHRLLRRVIERSDLPDKSDWETRRLFDFGVIKFLSVPDFIQKAELRAKVLKVAKSEIDLERDRGKKPKTDVAVETVMRKHSTFHRPGEALLSFCGEGAVEASKFQIRSR